MNCLICLEHLGVLARQSFENGRIESQCSVRTSRHLSGSLLALRPQPDLAQGSDGHGTGLHVSGWDTGSAFLRPRRIQRR